MALVPRAWQKTKKEWSAGHADAQGEIQALPLPLEDQASGRQERQSRRDDIALVRDFDALIARYYKPLFNLIFQWIGDRDEAEDLTQETFVAASKARDQFRGDSNAYTWLRVIAHNHCKNRFKQRDRQREIEGPSLDAALKFDGSDDDGVLGREIADGNASPESLLEQKELQTVIDRAVDGLAPEYKVVLILRHVEELSYNEIAEVTGLSLEAVKTRLNRARGMVRQRVEPYYRP